MLEWVRRALCGLARAAGILLTRTGCRSAKGSSVTGLFNARAGNLVANRDGAWVVGRASDAVATAQDRSGRAGQSRAGERRRIAEARAALRVRAAILADVPTVTALVAAGDDGRAHALKRLGRADAEAAVGVGAAVLADVATLSARVAGHAGRTGAGVREAVAEAMAALGVRPTFGSDLPASACNGDPGPDDDAGGGTGGGRGQACDETAAGGSGGKRFG